MLTTHRPHAIARRALPALALIGLAGSSALAVDVYSLGNGGAALLKYSTTNPGSVTAVNFTGGSAAFGPFLDSLDSRPANGQLYGYLDASDEVFTINTTTGALTKVSAASIGAGTTSFVNGLDWNPTIDRLRIVSDAGENNVYNPNTGTATAATALSYAAGDANFGVTPSVVDNAYTNSYQGAATTAQYVLDYGTNSLASLANNTGVLTTVAPVTLNGNTIDFDSFSGFDIYTDANKNNIAYAFLFTGGADGLYTINLASGAATLAGLINDAAYGDVYGLAVVPEPTSIAAIAGLSLLGRRRRR